MPRNDYWVSNENIGDDLNLDLLERLRTKALRAGVYFRKLTRVERAIVDLAIKCQAKFKSKTFVKTMAAIVAKILEALSNTFMARALRIGREMADRASKAAQSWGNMQAAAWKNDPGFILYSGITALSLPKSLLIGTL